MVLTDHPGEGLQRPLKTHRSLFVQLQASGGIFLGAPFPSVTPPAVKEPVWSSVFSPRPRAAAGTQADEQSSPWSTSTEGLGGNARVSRGPAQKLPGVPAATL